VESDGKVITKGEYVRIIRYRTLPVSEFLKRHNTAP
jgi:hypothetical protein